MTYLIYGAYGYTGELIAREAVRRGQQPILAGRDEAKLAPLAQELDLPYRAFSLDDPDAVARQVGVAQAVLHCAGPFQHTARPMAAGCLAAGVHYLDITGEISVFEGLAAQDARARQAGVLLLPGVGFDVVPTDCLAAHLARRLEQHGHQPVRLDLGFEALGSVSRGTARTMIENIDQGGAVRRGGAIQRVPTAWKTRRIDFRGDGKEKLAVTLPWGDVATAYRSTGIPDITVWLAVGEKQLRGMTWIRRLKPLLSIGPIKSLVQSRMRRKVDSGPAGPGDERRAKGKSYVWGAVESADGTRAVSRLRGPEGYSFTVLTALAAMDRVLAGEIEEKVAGGGYATPSMAFGPNFVMGIEGVERGDTPF